MGKGLLKIWGMGRPCKLTPELQTRLCEAIADGNYYEAACGVVGVSYKVFREWMIRGEAQTKGVFRDFRDAVEKAEADAEIRIVKQWQAHMPQNWQACRDFLARRHAERWGPKDAVQLTGDGGGPMQIEHTGKDGGPITYDFESLKKLPPDELLRIHSQTLGPPPESDR